MGKKYPTWPTSREGEEWPLYTDIFCDDSDLEAFFDGTQEIHYNKEVTARREGWVAGRKRRRMTHVIEQAQALLAERRKLSLDEGEQENE